ncbi:DoxX family protein [Metabacillus iocasae]|uniref:Membrane protein YphA (DoxX/SURF4 family) n=1 Tax=Priestia iocasae TaxID=2291674 RepID=A0ABS2QTH1_9BACI|nr:putative membrane protein YphA (DoxX/SURF4 family) [Metabacillus iocasae]
MKLGTLIVRITLGIIFFMHGLVKMQGGVENTAGWFDSIGLPGGLAYVVTFIELIGGALLIIGFGTRVVSALLASIMIGAILTVKLPAGLLGNEQMGGYELDLALLAMALHLLLAGSEWLSVDKWIKEKREN